MRVNQACRRMWVDWGITGHAILKVHASIADWVCCRQDDERDLGSAAAQVPQLSRHAAGPIPVPTATVSRDDCALGFPIGLRPVSAVTSLRWRMVSPPTEVGLVFENLEASSRVAQLEAEIAQHKDALPGGSRSEWRPGCWPSASPITPSGPGHCWYASPITAMSGSNIAQGHINAYCGRLTPAEVEILSVIEMQMPDVRLMGARRPGRAHQREFEVIGARHVPAGGP